MIEVNGEATGNYYYMYFNLTSLNYYCIATFFIIIIIIVLFLLHVLHVIKHNIIINYFYHDNYNLRLFQFYYTVIVIIMIILNK